MEEKKIIRSVSENPQPQTVAKDWGSYTVLHEEKDNLTILVILNEGHRMKYHSHEGRRELWIVASVAANYCGSKSYVKPRRDAISSAIAISRPTVFWEPSDCISM